MTYCHLRPYMRTAFPRIFFTAEKQSSLSPIMVSNVGPNCPRGALAVRVPVRLRAPRSGEWLTLTAVTTNTYTNRQSASPVFLATGTLK